MWDIESICGSFVAGLSGEAACIDDEQGVRGLDALREIDLHPHLAEGLKGAGFGVHREHPLPGLFEHRPKESARDRCDLVVTPEPGQQIGDLTREVKQRDKASGTLFEPVVSAQPLEAPGLDPSDALWLEIKSVAQHAFVSGVPGPNHAYSDKLLATRRDIEKLIGDDRIRFAGLVVVLFTEEEHTAEHDLAQLAHRCLDDDLPVSAPVVRSFAITDRIGNTCCSVGVLPVRLL